jgi:guanosine-3',5'-bis(diphosphate) 3'-pyrophosphohydrolase
LSGGRRYRSDEAHGQVHLADFLTLAGYLKPDGNYLVLKEMEQVLARIQQFADQAHGDQMRKYTAERYIVHPARVMKICQKYTDDICIHGAALLHDVVEDTPITPDDLRKFLSPLMNASDTEKTVKLVVELTDVYIKKDYPHLNRKKRKALEIERLAKVSPDAQTIKYADLIDNSIDIVQHDPQFGHIFVFEAKKLLSAMQKGNAELRTVATTTIQGCIEKLHHIKH